MVAHVFGQVHGQRELPGVDDLPEHGMQLSLQRRKSQLAFRFSMTNRRTLFQSLQTLNALDPKPDIKALFHGLLFAIHPEAHSGLQQPEQS